MFHISDKFLRAAEKEDSLEERNVFVEEHLSDASGFGLFIGAVPACERGDIVKSRVVAPGKKFVFKNQILRRFDAVKEPLLRRWPRVQDIANHAAKRRYPAAPRQKIIRPFQRLRQSEGPHRAPDLHFRSLFEREQTREHRARL